MPSDPTRPSFTRAQRRLLTALAGLVVAALAGGAYVLTYDVLRELALAGRVSRRWAPLYPAMADTLVALTILSLVVTRNARWWTRLLRWTLLLVLVAGGAAASVQHSVWGYGSLPDDAVRAGVAVAPHVMLVIAVWLWLTMFKQIRVARPAAEEAAPVETQRGHVKVLEPAAPPLALEPPADAEPLAEPEAADEEPLIPFPEEPPAEPQPTGPAIPLPKPAPPAPEPAEHDDLDVPEFVQPAARDTERDAAPEPAAHIPADNAAGREPAAPLPPAPRIPADDDAPEPPAPHSPAEEAAAPEPLAAADDDADPEASAQRVPAGGEPGGDEPVREGGGFEDFGYGGSLSSEPAPPLDALPEPRPPLDRVPTLLPTDVELVRGRDREDAEERPVASTTRPDIVLPGADEDLHDAPPADRAEDPDAGDPQGKDWNPPPSSNFRSGPTPPAD